MSVCLCYHDEQNFLHECGVCYGTKEKEPCSCGGNPVKCDFYEEVRKKYFHQSMTLEEAITIIREIDPSAEETNSRRAETLILQAVHDGANVEFPSDNISLHMEVDE